MTKKEGERALCSRLKAKIYSYIDCLSNLRWVKRVLIFGRTRRRAGKLIDVGGKGASVSLWTFTRVRVPVLGFRSVKDGQSAVRGRAAGTLKA